MAGKGLIETPANDSSIQSMMVDTPPWSASSFPLSPSHNMQNKQNVQIMQNMQNMQNMLNMQIMQNKQDMQNIQNMPNMPNMQNIHLGAGWLRNGGELLTK